MTQLTAPPPGSTAPAPPACSLTVDEFLQEADHERFDLIDGVKTERGMSYESA